MYYLRLFHGRKDPDQEMDGWGSDGPFVGPFEMINWCYGRLRLHTSDDFRELDRKQDDDMIKHDGVWYGDFEILYITGEEEANEMKDAVPFDEFFK
jgi:hypothetical protein